MSNRICPICKESYDDGGDGWKTVCYDCYKDYKFLQNRYDNPKARRIKFYGHKSNVYISHPSVTKEEMDEWIKASKQEQGWGVQEFKPENWSQYKIWVNSINYD